MMVGRCAGRVFDQSRSGVALAVAVHSLLEPVEQPVEAALRKIVIEVSQLGGGALEKLSREQISQGVGGKIADQPAAPVAVLQTPFRVIGWDDSQVTAIEFVPRAGD